MTLNPDQFGTPPTHQATGPMNRVRSWLDAREPVNVPLRTSYSGSWPGPSDQENVYKPHSDPWKASRGKMQFSHRQTRTRKSQIKSSVAGLITAGVMAAGVGGAGYGAVKGVEYIHDHPDNPSQCP